MAAFFLPFPRAAGRAEVLTRFFSLLSPAPREGALVFEEPFAFTEVKTPFLEEDAFLAGVFAELPDRGLPAFLPPGRVFSTFLFAADALFREGDFFPPEIEELPLELFFIVTIFFSMSKNGAPLKKRDR